MMYLFKSITYKLSGQTIEHLNEPGVATTMLGLLTYPDDFSKSQGLNQLWVKDTSTEAAAANLGFSARKAYVIAKPLNKGSFSFTIPLKHIFGFAQEYEIKHELTLVRGSDNDAIFRDATNIIDPGKIVLSNLSWFVPHVMPSDDQKLRLYKTIESKVKQDIGFRMRQCDSIGVPESREFTWRLSTRSSPERPRWVIVAFQTEKSNDQEPNPAIFDHCRVNDIWVTLNSQRYPAVAHRASFTNQRISGLYKEAADFRWKFFNMDHLVSNPGITPADFTDLHPLFVFDVSKKSERLKDDRRLYQGEIRSERRPYTQAYALVISDRILQFESDGCKMSFVY